MCIGVDVGVCIGCIHGVWWGVTVGIIGTLGCEKQHSGCGVLEWDL